MRITVDRRRLEKNKMPPHGLKDCSTIARPKRKVDQQILVVGWPLRTWSRTLVLGA